MENKKTKKEKLILNSNTEAHNCVGVESERKKTIRGINCIRAEKNSIVLNQDFEDDDFCESCVKINTEILSNENDINIDYDNAYINRTIVSNSNVNVKNDLRVRGSITAKNLRSYPDTNRFVGIQITHNLSADNVNVAGDLQIFGNCKLTGDLKSGGIFRVHGDLDVSATSKIEFDGEFLVEGKFTIVQ